MKICLIAFLKTTHNASELKRLFGEKKRVPSTWKFNSSNKLQKCTVLGRLQRNSSEVKQTSLRGDFLLSSRTSEDE